MAGGAGQPALSTGLSFRCDLRVASHADPELLQALQRVIPPLLIRNTVKGHVVKNHVGPISAQGGHGLLETRVKRHEDISPTNHPVIAY
jgi:hypothetical protein